MSRANSISLKLVMKLPAETRFKFIKKHYPTMNVDLVSSLINGFARVL